MNSKFVTTIAGTAEGIKLKRAQDVAAQAKLAQESLINELSKNVNVLEAALTRHLDIGPETTDSLRPVDKGFNADAWVSGVQSLKMDLKKANEKLAVARETYAEWFAEQPAPAATR